MSEFNKELVQRLFEQVFNNHSTTGHFSEQVRSMKKGQSGVTF